MKKINLKELKVFTAASKDSFELVSAVDALSNFFYKNVPYSEILESLMERIIENNGILEISAVEEKAIVSTFKFGMFPFLRDALLIAMNEDKLNSKVGDISNLSTEEKQKKVIYAMREVLKEVKAINQES